MSTLIGRRVATTAHLMTALVAIVLFGPPVAGARATAWSIDSVPLPRALGGQLEGVSCARTTSCVAVGYALQSGQTLVERWDGRAWSRQSSPNPLPGDGGVLRAVSCRSPRSCIAVGSDSSGDHTLVERLTGATWSIAEAGHPGSLDAISCPSADACVAVGSEVEYSYCCAITSPLAMRWSGGQWLSSHPATRASWADASLTSISCSSGHACTAAGSLEVGAACRYGAACARSPLLEQWNGIRWSIAPPPPLSLTAGASFTSISCTSDAHCTVLGYSFDPRGYVRAFAASRPGTQWRISEFPRPPGVTAMFPAALSCASRDDCTAVGNVVGLGQRVSILVADWNGSRWALPRVPVPAGPGPTFLNDVSCTSRAVCVAVGSAGNQPLIERSS